MSKSRARFLSELLGTTGLVKKSKSALAGADEIIDLSTLPSIPNSKLTNSSITINSNATSLGGSVTLTTANVAENTNLYYTDARADARIAAADTGDLSEGSNLYFTNARADARIAAATTDDLSEGSSNLYYTNARADARVALVVDSAPSTLNTLNELAAALGDDANFSTTVTNSIAAKLPLAGGTITGTVVFNSAPTFNTAITMGSSLNVASTVGIAGTTVIDSNRNLTNIGTISSGAITSSGTSTFGGVQIGGTTVISSSRNLTNIGTISSGSITAAGNIAITAGTGQRYIEIASGTSGAKTWRFYNGISWNPDALLIYDHTSDSTAVTIEPGKLGINRGANSLSQTLEVGGGALITGNLEVSNSINLGTATDGSRRFKWYNDNYHSLYYDNDLLGSQSADVLTYYQNLVFRHQDSTNAVRIGGSGGTIDCGSITSTGSVTATSNSGSNSAFNLGWQNSAIALRMMYDANYYMSIETHAQTRDLLIRSIAADNTGDVRIQTGTASSIDDKIVAKADGSVEIDGKARTHYVTINGVAEISEAFNLANNIQYDFEYTVPNEGGYGNSFYIIAGYNHHNSSTYGAHKVAFVSTRATALSTMINIGDQSHSYAGAWQFSKPNATTLRIRKTAGTYTGSGSGFIKVFFRNAIG